MMKNEKEILSILKDEQKSKEFFETLTGDDVRRYLIYINSKARNIPYEENQIYTGNMYTGGGLISPNNDIQNRFFDKIADALKNMKDNRCRGVALHYLINELHLFDDGNGRTGRCILELFTNPEFNFENNDNFSHNDGEYKHISTEDFEEQNGIKPYLTALTLPSFLVYKRLMENKLFQNDLPSDLTNVSTYTVKPFSEGNTDLIYINENIRQSFSDEEIKQINQALCDNNELEPYSVSGLTMMVMQHFIGDKTEVHGGEYNGIQYLIDKDECPDDARKIFKNWSKEDYIRAVQIYGIIKESMLEAMLDIFEHPENFKMEDGTTFAEVLSEDKGKQFDYPIEYAKELSNTAYADFTNTRIERSISNLEENLKGKNGILSTKELGKQVAEELSDVELTDNVQKQMNVQEMQLVENENQK